MTSLSAPVFWEELQAEFSAAVGAPLEITNLGFAPDLAGAEALSRKLTPRPEGGLALYQQQRWIRLFETLQSIYPRVTRGMGHFRFNELAHRYLLTYPPRLPDLGRTADHFAAFAADELHVRRLSNANSVHETSMNGTGIDHAQAEALLECLAWDEATRLAFIAPSRPKWQPNPTELSDIGQRHLRYHESFRLLEQRYAVQMESPPEERPVFVRLHVPEQVVTCREGAVVRTRSVPSDFARFLELTRTLSLARALDQLAEETAPEQRHALPTKVRDWLATSLERDYVCGLD